MENQRAGKFFLLLIAVLAFTFALTNFVGLSRGGFESSEILGLQTFYLIGGIFAFMLFLGYMYESHSHKGDAKYGTSIAFSSLGEKPHFSFFKRFTTIQLVFLSIIFFSIIALASITITSQQTYTGMGFLESQQFTTTDNIIYSVFLIAGSENLGAAAFIALIIISLGVFARKVNMTSGSHKTWLLVLIVIGLLLFGVGNHLLRYRSSEIALTTVGVFWAVGGLITAATGSFIPFWIMHMLNNLFYYFSRQFSNEFIFAFTIGFVVVIGIIYSLIYSGRLLGRKGES